MSFFTSFVSLLFLLPYVASAAEQQCYGLDGTELDRTYGPCKPGARHSGCCAIHRPAGSVDICLDNGLCMATNDEYMGTIWQDGCTDPTGKDPGCPKMCPDVTNDSNRFKPFLAWNIQMCDYGSYCCREVDDHESCCNNATAPKIQTKNLGAFQFETSTAGTSATTAAVTLTSSRSSSTTSSQEPTLVVGTAVSTGVPLSQSTSTSLPRPDETCKKDKSAMVGGAVGGTLSAVILALLGMIFWMHSREKHQRKLKEHYEEQFGQNFAYRRTIVVESDSLPVTPSEKDTDVVIEKEDKADRLE